jgi:hypothetical protein
MSLRGGSKQSQTNIKERDCHAADEHRQLAMTIQKEILMAYYLVKAKYQKDLLDELRTRLDSGEINKMRPFGTALQYSLDNARIDPQAGEGWTVWEEEDYCNPPLAQERAAVLDTYFTSLRVEKVTQGGGWARIDSLPKLWKNSNGGMDAL